MSSMPENLRKPAARQPIKAGDHLILVDGSGFIFRAFHALPPTAAASRDGLPTSAVLGFCNMIWKLLQEGPTPEPGDEPTHFAVIFDYSAKTFRNEIYPDYKAHRPDPPSDLIPQFGLIRQATRAFNLPASSRRAGRPTTSSRPMRCRRTRPAPPSPSSPPTRI